MNIDTRVSRRDLPTIILVVLVALLGGVFILSQIVDLSPAATPTGAVTCPQDDMQALHMALEKHDSQYCGCHDDADAMRLCETSVADAVAYARAIEYRTPALCDVIVDTTRQAACRAVIEQSPMHAGHNVCPDMVCNAAYEGVVTAVTESELTLGASFIYGEPAADTTVSVTMPASIEVRAYDMAAEEYAAEAAPVAVSDTVAVTLADDGAAASVVIITQ